MSEKVLLLPQAAKAAGMTPRTLRRRLAQGDIPAYVDPSDKRRKLVRVADLKRYMGVKGLQTAA